MRAYLLSAGVVAILVGLGHSILGELLVFKKLRHGTLVPDEPAPPLQARNVRILWAIWHLASAFGFGFAAILLSLSSGETPLDPTIIWALILTYLGAAA